MRHDCSIAPITDPKDPRFVAGSQIWRQKTIPRLARWVGWQDAEDLVQLTITLAIEHLRNGGYIEFLMSFLTKNLRWRRADYLRRKRESQLDTAVAELFADLRDCVEESAETINHLEFLLTCVSFGKANLREIRSVAESERERSALLTRKIVDSLLDDWPPRQVAMILARLEQIPAVGVAAMFKVTTAAVNRAMHRFTAHARFVIGKLLELETESSLLRRRSRNRRSTHTYA